MKLKQATMAPSKSQTSPVTIQSGVFRKIESIFLREQLWLTSTQQQPLKNFDKKSRFEKRLAIAHLDLIDLNMKFCPW